MIIPGIGTPPPSDWSDYSGQWLQELQKLHGGKVLIWHYVYEAVKGQAIVASVLQQSHALTAELHKLNPREVRPVQADLHGTAMLKAQDCLSADGDDMP